MSSSYRMSPMDALTPDVAPTPGLARVERPASERAAAGQGLAATDPALRPEKRPNEAMVGGLSAEDTLRVATNIGAAHAHVRAGWQDRTNAVLGLGQGLLEDKIEASPSVVEELARATIGAVTTALAAAATGGLAVVGAGVQSVAKAAVAAALKAGVNEAIAAFGAEPHLSVAGFVAGQTVALAAARDAMMNRLEGSAVQSALTAGPRAVQASAGYAGWGKAMGAGAMAAQTTTSLAAWGRALERRSLGRHGRRNHRDGKLAGAKDGVLEVVIDSESLASGELAVASAELVGVGRHTHDVLARQARELPVHALLGDHGLTLHVTDTNGLLDLTSTADKRGNPVFPRSGRAMIPLRRRAREVYGLDADEAMPAAAARLVAELGDQQIGALFGGADRTGDEKKEGRK